MFVCLFVCNTRVKKKQPSPSLHDCERFNIFTQKVGFGKVLLLLYFTEFFLKVFLRY